MEESDPDQDLNAVQCNKRGKLGDGEKQGPENGFPLEPMCHPLINSAQAEDTPGNQSHEVGSTDDYRVSFYPETIAKKR